MSDDGEGEVISFPTFREHEWRWETTDTLQETQYKSLHWRWCLLLWLGWVRLENLGWESFSELPSEPWTVPRVSLLLIHPSVSFCVYWTTLLYRVFHVPGTVLGQRWEDKWYPLKVHLVKAYNTVEKADMKPVKYNTVLYQRDEHKCLGTQ